MSAAPVLVTPTEGDLLALARSVWTGASAQLERWISGGRDAPQAMGPEALRALEQTLVVGATGMLLRGGGWRKERGLRLWERLPLPPLKFTLASVTFLQWMLETPLMDPRTKAPDWPPVPLALGDELLLARALLALLHTPCERVLAALPLVRQSALCGWLAPGALGRAGPFTPAPLALDAGEGRFAAEALQGLAAETWAREERFKPTLSEPALLQAMGEAQGRALDGFLRAADAAQARHLTSFLVEAARRLRTLGGAELCGALDSRAPLRHRMAAREASGGLLRALGTLRRWDLEHRAVRFIDDGYEEAQALVRAWEPFGDAGFRAAEEGLAALLQP